MCYEKMEYLDTFVEKQREYMDLKMDMDAILKVIPEYIFICNREGKALRVSSSWKNLWWQEGNDFFEKSVFDIEKDGVISPSASRLAIERGEQVQIIQKTNTGKTLMVIGTPIKDEKGNIVKVISVSKDITEIDVLKEQLDYEKSKSKQLYQQFSEERESTLIYTSEEMIYVLTTAHKISDFNSTVLILGESGVGKEEIASHIHRWSDRSDKPFIKINCGSIPENLLESELFGYEKGAFTGALKEGKIGLIEAADKGTLFLDEIGEMPHSLQVRLLRVLQEKEVTRIGDTKSRKVDVRIITATNRDLRLEVKEKRFREDLYYRINVVPIVVPPLRERKADLLPLIIHFTEVYNKKFSKKKIFSPKSIELLYRYDWPGNVRELKNIVERIIITVDYDYIEPMHLTSFVHILKDSVEHALYEGKVRDSFLFPHTHHESTVGIEVSLIRNYRKLGITHGELGLYCAIMSYQKNNKRIGPSIDVLADVLQCSTRQIRKWIHSLKKKGYLIIEQSFDSSTEKKESYYNFQQLHKSFG